MAYELPAHGEANWDTKLNASIAAVKETADAAIAQTDLVFYVAKEPFSATFNNAADVTDEIQAALDAAAAALATVDAFTGVGKSATVVLPIGYGKITGLTVPDNVRLVGQGDRTILVVTSGSNANAIQSESWGDRTAYNRGIRITDMRIIGNEANQAANLCPQTFVTTDTAVSTVGASLPVYDTTGFDSSGLAWVGFQVVAYTGKTSNSLTGVTLYSGSDTLRKMTWVTPYASKGHLVAIQGRNCFVEIYGDTAAGDGIHFQGPDPLASGGVIVPENRVGGGTRVNSCRGYGLAVGQNTADGTIEGRPVLGPDNLRGALLMRSDDWTYTSLHPVGTFGDEIAPIPQALLIGGNNFRGGHIMFDTWPGTTIVYDGSISGLALGPLDTLIVGSRHFQSSWGAGAGGHGVLFRGIKNRTTMRGMEFAHLNMSGPIAKGFTNGPWTRLVGTQNLASLTGNKLQVTNAMDFAPASAVGGSLSIGSESLTYTGRQMNFTKLTADAAIGDTVITVASTTGFDSSGSLTLLAEANGSYTPQTITYTGKTATTFTGIPSSSTGSITATTSSSGERGQVSQHFFTGVSAGGGSASNGTSCYSDEQTCSVSGLARDTTFRSYQVDYLGMQPSDTFFLEGGTSAGLRIPAAEEGSRLTTGEESQSRETISSTAISQGTQQLRLTYFTAKKTEAITQVRLWSGGTAAGATPSLIRVGIWTTDETGALLSLVASTASDTTLLAATNTEYTKALSATWRKVRGQRYAVGLLVVTAATAPQVCGATFGSQNAIMGQQPVMCASVAGQSDLPSTLAAGSISASVNRPYFVLLP